MDLPAERWYIVVVIEPIRNTDGQKDAMDIWAASRRTYGPGVHGEFSGEWRLLDEEEARQLAAAINADDKPGFAQVVAVYRYEGDPVWTAD